MTFKPGDAKSLFLQAMERPEQDRAAFLEAACAGQPELKARVQTLLDRASNPDSLLDKPVAGAWDATRIASSDNAPLDFLDPCDVPGSLGRIRDYPVMEVIGRGGMGIVLRALDSKLNRVVAIKVLVPELAGNFQARKRFLREAQAAAAVSHDHVVTIHAVDDSETLPFLVMECILGQSLQQKLDREGPLSLPEILRIGMQTAAGLAAAHSHGLVHRDIKPANILLENGVQRVKLTDFGLARLVDDASVTQSGLIAGTPQYMSPEQARGEAIDTRSDLFSLGCVLYAMSTGHAPFRASTTMGVLKRVCEDAPRPIREFQPELPEWLQQIISGLLAKDPADRFQSAEDVAALLRNCLAHVQQPQLTPLPDTLRPASEARTEHRTAAVAGRFDAHELSRQIVRPARFLVATALLNWLALIVCIPVLAYWPPGWGTYPSPTLVGILFAVLGVGSAVILFGAVRMAQQESLAWAKASAIAAMIVGPGYLIGWPAGIWALAVLTRRDIQAAFRHAPASRPMPRIVWAAAGLAAVFLAGWTLITPQLELTPTLSAPFAVQSGSGAPVDPTSDGGPDNAITGAQPTRATDAPSFAMRPAEAVDSPAEVRGSKAEISQTDADSSSTLEPLRAPFTAQQAAQGQANWAQHLSRPVELTAPHGMKMRLIPPGSFQMGSTPAELEALRSEVTGLGGNDYDIFIALSSGPRHRVELSEPFYLGSHEVTVGQYRKFIGSTGYQPSAERAGTARFSWTKFVPSTDADQHPVCGVSWKDAEAFCEWLTRESGESTSLVFGLPTEAQWEYACRAGTESLWSFGNNPEALSEHAITGLKGSPHPAPVGLRRPNPFGLFDMHGNVDEWCLDWHNRDFYGRSPLTDPLFNLPPTDTGSGRVARGGAWNADSWWSRSATRAYDYPESPTFSKGFRVALRIPPQPRSE